jgi:hypothetical protein
MIFTNILLVLIAGLILYVVTVIATRGEMLEDKIKELHTQLVEINRHLEEN